MLKHTIPLILLAALSSCGSDYLRDHLPLEAEAIFYRGSDTKYDYFCIKNAGSEQVKQKKTLFVKVPKGNYHDRTFKKTLNTELWIFQPTIIELLEGEMEKNPPNLEKIGIIP